MKRRRHLANAAATRSRSSLTEYLGPGTRSLRPSLPRRRPTSVRQQPGSLLPVSVCLRANIRRFRISLYLLWINRRWCCK